MLLAQRSVICSTLTSTRKSTSLASLHNRSTFKTSVVGMTSHRTFPAEARVRAKNRQTVDTPRAPGSESNFTGLPEDENEIRVTSPVTSKQMQEHIDLTRQEFRFVFKNILDKDHFESKIYFRDPITNVSFFRAPIYELHEIRQIGDQELLVKWSWTMNFWWNRYNPLKYFWDPRLVFTGFTVLGYNPTSGKWNKHVDGWDSIKDSEFFSLEGFAFAFSQMFNVSTPPNRLTPEFQIYKKYKDFEIRRYRPFITAEIALDELENSEEAVGTGPGIKEEAERAQKIKAETMLERYLAIGNDRNEFFQLTTPLFISQTGTYSLMIPGYKTVEDLPKPHKTGLINLRQHPEQFYASISFGGSPGPAELKEKADFLFDLISKEGSRPQQKDWIFARYNQQKTFSAKGPWRRNDLLIPLEADSVDLWRGVDWAFIDRVKSHPV